MFGSATKNLMTPSHFDADCKPIFLKIVKMIESHPTSPDPGSFCLTLKSRIFVLIKPVATSPDWLAGRPTLCFQQASTCIKDASDLSPAHLPLVLQVRYIKFKSTFNFLLGFSTSIPNTLTSSGAVRQPDQFISQQDSVRRGRFSSGDTDDQLGSSTIGVQGVSRLHARHH